MKKTATYAGSGQDAKSDLILHATEDQHSTLQHLPMLEGIGPLLPGKSDKRPSVGDNWPDHHGLSIAQLQATTPECICWNIGAAPGYIAIDIDGEAAAAFCQRHGCDPYTADTWRIIRTSNNERLKLVFTVTPDQRAQLVAGAKTVKIDGQELAVFAKPGTQIVVLGNHYTKESNHTENDDQYAWAGRNPADAQPLPPKWFALLTGVFCGERPLRPPTRRTLAPSSPRKVNAYSSGSDWRNSCQRQPCPMCGRDHSGACSISRDRDSVWCCHGETKSAPDCSKAGETVPGTDGRTWAYVRTEEHDSFGERSLFVLDKPQHPAMAAASERFTPRPGSTANWGQRRMGHTRRMRCLDRCIVVQAQRERNSLRRRARLLKAARDLELHTFVKAQDIAQGVLEAKAGVEGNSYQALTSTDRSAMPKPVVRWLLPGLVPANDLTIIGGRPKVGKTRLAVAIAASVLSGESLLDLPKPVEPKSVVLVTDDQSDGDTANMLSAVGMWDHPGLIWSRSFRLTETDIDRLLVTVKENPGSLVVLDSLRSIGRTLQHGENDPEIGATLYDLKQAVIDSGGTLMLIHHCNKAPDLLGVEALSGHNAISGAANTVLTMHYLPGENNQPNKTAPERRLFREGRSGEGFDLVITRASNTFRKVATFDQWQQQSKEANKAERLTTLQQQIKEALEAAPDDWKTRRQVCEAIDVHWSDRGRNQEARRVGDALRRLVEVKAVESARSGTEATYRASHEHNRTTRTDQPIRHANGFQLSNQNPDNPDNPDSDAVCLGMSGMSQNSSDIEKPVGNLLARLSGVSARASHAPSAIGSVPSHSVRTPYQQTKIAGCELVELSRDPQGSGADAFSEGDDPAWGPRPEVGS